MTFEYFNNFFNTTTTTTTAVNITTTCPTKVNICNSNDDAGGGGGGGGCDGSDAGTNNKKSSYFTTTGNGKKENAFAATATVNNSTRLCPTALRRKIRKTSRRKWKRKCNGYVHNNIVYMADTIKKNKTTTTTEAVTSAPIATSSHKCKISVNNTRTTNLNSYIYKYKKKNNIVCTQRKYFRERTFLLLHNSKNVLSMSSCGSNITNTNRCCCDRNCCSNYCNCSCSSRRKTRLIVKNIVSLLVPQTTLIKTATKLAHRDATAKTTTARTQIAITENKYLANNDKRKKVQLHLKSEKLLQLKNLYALEKCVIKANKKQQHETTKNQTPADLPGTAIRTTATQISCKSSMMLPAPPIAATMAIATKQISATSSSSSSSFLSSSLEAANNCSSNHTFSTILPKCKKSTTTTNLNKYYSRSKPSVAVAAAAAVSSYSTWYSITCLAPARILNELYGVIFMTLLVLSICHNNVLETSAASVKISRRDVVANTLVAEQKLQANRIEATAVRLSERPFKRQHPPEQITARQYQQQYAPQTNNDNKNMNSNHHQPHSYSNEQVVEQQQQQKPQQPLENQVEEDDKESNHIFQAQIQHETWPTYEQHYERDQKQKYHQQQQQQHLTTEPAITTTTTFSNGIALETAYNNTFQSLSIIDGDLTVAIDTSQNLMTIEEEMLVAASGGAVGVGSNAIGLGNHLHTSNNGLGSYDMAVMGIDGGFNVMTHNFEKHSMPIFDFGMPRNITARTGHTEAIIKCRVDRLDDKSVSWIRKRDLHILTVGTATYTSDKRFQVTESKDSREWTLHVKSPQARDSGIYECQVNTEPKMSMAFQLNVIEISPDAKAVIIGPADLHFKVGSAIILTCLVHQPSVKDIGLIYWYRGEYMITPFDINENTHEVSAFPLAGYSTPQAVQNKINALEQNHFHSTNDPYDGGTVGGGSGGDVISPVVGRDTEQIPQILTNEITQDFAQRIAMESQLGDTMKSRLRISNAQTLDTGNYTCQPTTASSASVMVHVINDENPAAMQKSRANNFHYKRKGALMYLICVVILVSIAATISAPRFKIVYTVEAKGYANDVGRCCCCWLSSTNVMTTRTLLTLPTTTFIKMAITDISCIMLSCLRLHVISKNMLESFMELMRQQQQPLLQYNLPHRYSQQQQQQQHLTYAM